MRLVSKEMKQVFRNIELVDDRYSRKRVSLAALLDAAAMKLIQIQKCKDRRVKVRF